MGNTLDPGQRRLEAEGLAGVVEIAKPRAGDLHPHRFEHPTRLGGYRPLNQAQVARANGSQRARKPGLLFQPVERIEAIMLLVAERVKFASRPERASAALHQHLEAALGKGTSKYPGKDPGAAIRAAHQDGWRVAMVPGVVVVGKQHHAITHGYAQIMVYCKVIGFAGG